MPIRTCNKCGKEFSRKDAYEQHINRIRPCSSSNEHIEIFTDKITELEKKIIELEEKNKELCNIIGSIRKLIFA